MLELWLKFKDPKGEDRRVCVDNEKFSIGRHSENDLSISDGRLSREHALIERFGDIFVLSDRGSSNGTEVNGEKLTDPKAIKSGDKISFGGLIVETEFEPDDSAAQESAGNVDAAQPKTAPPPYAAPVPETGLPTSFFYIAPIFAVVILVGIGILLYAVGGAGKATADNRNLAYPIDLDDPSTNRKGKDNDPGEVKKGSDNDIILGHDTPGNSSVPPGPTPTASDPEIVKTENNASLFLRHIAQNDPRAFVIGEPAKIVLAKIKSISGSSALASNINSARRNANQIKSLAAAKNIKPDLLAVAAITKLGNSSGDVLQTAQSMAEPLDRLSTQLSGELGEECLIIIAVYDQGAAGDFLKMRNILQDLATKMPDAVRDIRTIWYLKKQNKITDAEYDFAVRFLAIGTIAQNPKDFGVNAEALKF